MNLKKQLFAAFLTVAFLPLIAVGIYIFATNLMLALDLHQQNLTDSTQIQGDLVEENINQLMVRSRRFASSGAVKQICEQGAGQGDTAAPELSSNILNFTDETLDNVAVFALLDQKGTFIYASGSVSDNEALQKNLPQPLSVQEQKVTEIPFDSQANNIAIYTPVQVDNKIVGTFVVVCRTDYMLKLISSHRQLELSNTLIYCKNHNQIVAARQPIADSLSDFSQKLGEKEKGSLICKINGQQTMVYYQNLSKTPWVMVSTVSSGQIFSQIWNYLLINVGALLVVFAVILFLSRRQSRKILQPLEQLLSAVEAFFLGGATQFPSTDIDAKTEIGYLAEKFTNLSEEMAQAQGKIRESNYLYAALLKATYDFRIVVDFQNDQLECSSGKLSERFHTMAVETAVNRLQTFFFGENEDPDPLLQQIISGKIAQPLEAEIHLRLEDNQDKKWYRVVAVPVIQGETVSRVALHFEDITEKKTEELRLIQSSQTDPLCGLYNKTAFFLHYKKSPDCKEDAVFFIDLDKFKQVNDTLGHNKGDEVLVSTAQAIRAQFREGDVIGRFGGDEFVVFAPGIGQKIAERKAAALVRTISYPISVPGGDTICVSASVGVCIPSLSMSMEQSIRAADEAMYLAKQNGRAQYYILQQPGCDFPQRD